MFQLAFESAMELYALTKSFPREERYSLTDQIRRSSRSVCANIAEAFRKRGYPKSFCSKLSDAEAEAAETQVWIEFARRCGHLTDEQSASLGKKYDFVIGKIVVMLRRPENWKV